MNNVKDAKKIVSYAFYSQIWLNYLNGWVPFQLHHKNEEINSVSGILSLLQFCPAIFLTSKYFCQKEKEIKN